MTKFSISVPIGSWHPFLPFCLDSLRVQNADLSVAVIDASNDPRVMKLVDQHDSWISYRSHGPDAGQSDAIMKGWAAVKGDWLGWLNADDVLMPDALERVLDKQKTSPECEVIYGHSNIVDEQNRLLGYHFNVEPPSDRILQAGIISQPSCFFSRDAYERAGGLDTNRHFTMDWDLWIRLFNSGARFGFIDGVLSTVLWGNETKTSSFSTARQRELKDILQTHAPIGRHRQIFRAFAIHALVDKVWPDSLRNMIVRRLRKNGPRLFGLRADGQIESVAELKMAHFETSPKSRVALRFSSAVDAIVVESDPPPSSIVRSRNDIQIDFGSHLTNGETCAIRIFNDADPIWFDGAEWL